MTEKKVEDLSTLADKEDALDDLFDEIRAIFEQSTDWMEENFSEAMSQLSNADMVGDFRDSLSTFDDIQAEIKNLLKLRNDNYHLIEKAEELEDEIHELRNKV
tara:strand:+ start:2794 stop:3102 length:309 start_codon:yes stop_codon:yes gene_type:complete